MKLLVVGAAVAVVCLGSSAGVAVASKHVPQSSGPSGSATLMSVRLAALGSNVSAPRGPYSARPTKIAFDLGGYYGAGTKGLWIDHLKWTDWGKPVAFASGIVHARIWPSKNFITTPGGIMIDQLRSCGAERSYYTNASMVIPAGFPQNTQAMAYATSEQALTSC